MGHLLTTLAGNKLIAKDSFNRTDSNTSVGKADSGQLWTALTGTWGIINNTAYLVASTGANKDAIVIDTGACDCEIQFTIGTLTNPTRLTFRFTDADNGFIVNTETAYVIYRFQAAGFNNIGSSGVAPVQGDKVKVRLQGSTIKLYINNILVLTRTSTFNQSATKHGLGANDGSLTARFDDFLVTRL